MANQGKHPRSPLTDWLEGEETPTMSRGSHVVDSYIKKGKATLKKFRRRAAPAAAAASDPALVRDAAPPAKADAGTPPSGSWDHLRRMERLPQLRAPYPYKGR